MAIVASPLLAFLIAVLAMWSVRLVQRRFGVHEDSEFFRWAQIGSSAFVSWGHGANDAQKTMGIVAATLYAAGFLHAGDAASLHPPYWAILLANLAIAAGTVWGGWKIIETMGLKITRITSRLRFRGQPRRAGLDRRGHRCGIPISTTQAVSSSIIGSGVAPAAGQLEGPHPDGHRLVLTLPAAAAIGFESAG